MWLLIDASAALSDQAKEILKAKYERIGFMVEFITY